MLAVECQVASGDVGRRLGQEEGTRMSARRRAISLLATAGFVLAACTGTTTPGTTTPGTTAPGTTAPGTTWTKVSDTQALKGVYLNGVAAGAGGFAAVGSKTVDSVVLVSSDGIAWTPLSGDVFSLVNLRAVAADGSGFIAAGNQCGGGGGKCVGARIMRSVDGRSFQDVRDLPAAGLDAEIRTVAVGSSGYIAAGVTGYCGPGDLGACGTFLFSPDGVTWTAASEVRQFDDSLVNAVVPVPGGPGFVAVGVAPIARRAVVWTSSNGKDWQRSLDSPAFDDGGMSAVVSDGSGFLAVGWAGSEGAGAAVWTSADGSSWTRVPDSPDLAGAQMQSVVKLDGGFVAIGWGSTGAAAWTSPDGTTWKKAPTAGSFADVEMVSLALGATVLVAVGPPTPSGNATAIWTSPSVK
jgi:hypothetical protein